MMKDHHTPTVDFIVSAESAQAVAKLLVANQIAFSIAFSDSSTTTLQEATPTDDLLESASQESREETIYEIIYRKYIEEGMGKGQIPPKESQIATEFGINLTMLKNGFKTIYGKPFYQLYMEKRMEYAKTLLLKGWNAAKVSQLIGYSQPIKFNRMFQKHYGITPKNYQRLDDAQN